jgi:hypothetical protein
MMIINTMSVRKVRTESNFAIFGLLQLINQFFGLLVFESSLFLMDYQELDADFQFRIHTHSVSRDFK